MHYRLALQRCREWVLDLKALWRETGEPVFSNDMVRVTHHDGTQYSFQCAKAVTYRVPDSDYTFLVVFTEHQKDHIFTTDELVDYSQWTPSPRGVPELDEQFCAIEDPHE